MLPLHHRLAPRFGSLLAGILLGLASTPAWGAITGLTRIAAGLSQPVFATHAPGDSNRLFIVEKQGAIKILDLTTGLVRPTNFLTVSGLVTSSESGLLGLAFHPDYATNGKFYTTEVRSNGGVSYQGANTTYSTFLREYTVSPTDPNVAVNSPRTLAGIPQPQDNHKGGWIGFQPQSGLLYWSVGDGGASNDSGTGHTSGSGNAQDITGNLLGKMLRVDVDRDDFLTDSNRNYGVPADNPFVGITGDDEIWSYGLRNPWRSSFDRVTGDLWIGDVGQGAREEINFEPVTAASGRNYGWRLREGTIATPTSGIGGAAPPGAIDPVYDYLRPQSGFSNDFRGQSVTGGYLYRGPDPDLRGQYFFGDFVITNVWTYQAGRSPLVTRINPQLVPSAGTLGSISSFGEDADGNLYIVDYGGEVFRIATSRSITGDASGSGGVTSADFDLWFAAFGGLGALATDFDADGSVDAGDFTLWRDNLGRGTSARLGEGSAVPEPAAVGLLLLGLAPIARRRRR